MPKEEKEKKKFKAVTEELMPLSAPSNEEPKDSDSKPEAIEKKILAVSETKNVDKESEVQEKGVFLKFFLITFLATLLALVLAGGVYVYLNGTKRTSGENVEMVNQTPTPSQLPEVTATPVVTLDLASYEISVLNGSGGIGVATAAKNIIERVGFEVASVGNAENFNFTDTMIQVKSSVPADVVSKLRDALGKSYPLVIGDVLSAQSNFDIVVTVGAKR